MDEKISLLAVDQCKHPFLLNIYTINCHLAQIVTVNQLINRSAICDTGEPRLKTVGGAAHLKLFLLSLKMYVSNFMASYHSLLTQLKSVKDMGSETIYHLDTLPVDHITHAPVLHVHVLSV